MPNPKLSYKRFFWHKESRSFVGEISELREWNPSQPIHLQGKKEVVTYGGGDYRTLQNEEGEIIGWELRPSQGEMKRVPACAGTKVVVYND